MNRSGLTVVCLVMTGLMMSCANAPVSKPAPSLGAVTAAIDVAQELNRDSLTIARKIEQEGTPVHSVEAKQLVKLIEQKEVAHNAANDAVASVQNKVNVLAKERDDLAGENVLLKKAGSKTALVCYVLCAVMFGAGFLVSKLCLQGVALTGFWGLAFGWLATKIGLDSLVGIGFMAAGFVILKIVLPVLMHWHWLLNLMF